MSSILRGLVLLCCLLVTMPINAHPPESGRWALPPSEWNTETRLWLSRAMTAEVGWNNSARRQKEQIALAYILVKRYYIRKALDNTETFLNTIRTFCNGMKVNRQRITKRQRWLRNIPEPLTEFASGKEVVIYPIEKPLGWPKKVSWEKHQYYFGRTWVVLGEWAHGQHKNPCPRAKYWGSPTDIPPANAVRICTNQQFESYMYGVR